MPNSSRKSIKKILHFKSFRFQICKIRNVRVQQHNLCVLRKSFFFCKKKLNWWLRHQIKRSADRKYWFKIAWKAMNLLLVDCSNQIDLWGFGCWLICWILRNGLLDEHRTFSALSRFLKQHCCAKIWKILGFKMIFWTSLYLTIN